MAINQQHGTYHTQIGVKSAGEVEVLGLPLSEDLPTFDVEVRKTAQVRRCADVKKLMEL